MKLAVITACCFENEDPIHFLWKSCQRFGITLFTYGVGTAYTDWPDIKITQMLAQFKKMYENGMTHVLYTDGRDSFFVSGLSEIVHQYRYLDSPGCLMATETEPYPRRELRDRFPDPGHHFRWPGTGQFMGDLEYLIPAWQMLIDDYMHVEGEDQNEQGWIQDAFVQEKFGPEFKLDTGCEIFQSAGNGSTSVLLTNEGNQRSEVQVRRGRIYNSVTGSWPSVIHFNGGYSDPVTGKDAILQPVWDAIGGWPT